MTDLERYCTGILDGKIVACRRMKQVAEHDRRTMELWKTIQKERLKNGVKASDA